MAQQENLLALFPSIFDEEDNVYNTDPILGDCRPSSYTRKRTQEAETRRDIKRRAS